MQILKMISIGFVFLLTPFAVIAAPMTLNVGFGSSIPKDLGGFTYMQKAGPNRAAAEHLELRLSSAMVISEIKLVSYSTGKAGKTLVREATAYNGKSASKLEGLYQFSKVTSGKPVNYNGLVMIPVDQFVSVSPNQAITRLDLYVEGFTDNDASLLLQVTFQNEIRDANFLLTRTSGSETSGSYVNESNFAKFSADNLRALMSIGTTPTSAELAGKNFKCSSYTRLDANRVDFKTRNYFVDGAGVLYSSSTVQGPAAPWVMTEDGLAMALEGRNGCGGYTTYNIVRKTGEGNLVSEVVTDLEAYVDLCTRAGYDTSATRELMNYSTFPSILNQRFVVGSYEFCHL